MTVYNAQQARDLAFRVAIVSSEELLQVMSEIRVAIEAGNDYVEHKERLSQHSYNTLKELGGYHVQYAWSSTMIKWTK